MVLDSSALVAMHIGEPGYLDLFDKVARAQTVLVGTPTAFETAMVLTRKLGHVPRVEMQRSFERMNVRLVPFSEEHMHVALDAFLRYGKGWHPAGLNFGDCMAYAVASVARLPLLYAGTDFSKTDIQSA
ncbi:MAG TPA: type II toxin-antitoxin system VapC family toxin [Bryobacteraceae bacterium]|nr:type II toxin-antitoxin system VapC family toxin [Bryobacteraceae bacterium]